MPIYRHVRRFTLAGVNLITLAETVRKVIEHSEAYNSNCLK